MDTSRIASPFMHHLVEPRSFFSFVVTQPHVGQRIDIFLAHHFTCYSRSFFQRLVDSNHVTLNGTIVRKQGTALKLHDVVAVTFPEAQTINAQELLRNKAVTVTCMHQDEHFLVIAKPADFVTHKPKDNYTEPTVVDWLNLNFQEIAAVGYIDRPGIVHRLDKDTSGLMLIARTQYGHKLLSELFKQRAVHKTYLAIVEGHPPKTGSIATPIGRHPVYRTKMTTMAKKDPLKKDTTLRDALTNYEVVHYFENSALVQAKPVTGRTHQIRVHFASIGHPLLGDLLYGKKSSVIARQALHAYALSFTCNGVPYAFTLNPPQDFTAALASLNGEYFGLNI